VSGHSPHFQSLSWFGPESFAVRSFFENGRSFIAAQRAFRLHFKVPRRDPVPHRNVIAGWVRALEETTGSTTARPIGVREDQNR